MPAGWPWLVHFGSSSLLVASKSRWPMCLGFCQPSGRCRWCFWLLAMARSVLESDLTAENSLSPCNSDFLTNKSLQNDFQKRNYLHFYTTCIFTLPSKHNWTSSFYKEDKSVSEILGLQMKPSFRISKYCVFFPAQQRVIFVVSKHPWSHTATHPFSRKPISKTLVLSHQHARALPLHSLSLHSTEKQWKHTRCRQTGQLNPKAAPLKFQVYNPPHSPTDQHTQQKAAKRKQQSHQTADINRSDTGVGLLSFEH